MTFHQRSVFDDFICCSDSTLLLDILPERLAMNSFSLINKEVIWSEMYLKGSVVPRLVCIQGTISVDHIEPIYRHPADFHPELTIWTPAMQEIRDIVSERLKSEINHALIQLYRSGHDSIGEHSDKTLDIARGSSVMTLSLGAKRTLILRSKLKSIKDPGSKKASGGPRREVWKIPLPHNSLFILGSVTNGLYMHSIKEDNRLPSLKTAEEVAFGGQRISLTFRCISTFYDRKSGHLLGQGAPRESTDTSCSLSQSDKSNDKEMIDDYNRLLCAFSAENKLVDFDWDHYYGSGFRHTGIKHRRNNS